MRRQTTGLNLRWKGSREGQKSRGREPRWGAKPLTLAKERRRWQEERRGQGHGGPEQVQGKVNRRLLYTHKLLTIFYILKYTVIFKAFLNIDFSFQSRFRFTAKQSRDSRELPCTRCPHIRSKTEQREQRAPMYPLSPYTQPPPLLTSPTRAVHLLKSMNLHWCIVTNRSSLFTLRFTLGVVHSMGLDKCIMMCIQHYSIKENSFTTGKKSHFAYSSLLFFLQNSWQTLTFSLSL